LRTPRRYFLKNCRGVQQWYIDQINDPELQSAHPQFSKISQSLTAGNKNIWEIDAGSFETILSFWYRTKWAAYGRQKTISGDVDRSSMVAAKKQIDYNPYSG
jgi:hypothetical protein